jgi:hypothetical protein
MIGQIYKMQERGLWLRYARDAREEERAAEARRIIN